MMGVSREWDNSEKTIMRFVIENPWNMGDIYKLTDEMKVMLKTEGITYPIGVIIDASAIRSLPAGIIQSTGPMIRRMQPETAVVVVVSPHRFLKAMYDVFTKLYDAYAGVFQFRLSLDEARALIVERLGSHIS
jgi:hypothetical protein